ncbi:MAG: hypothetical protein A2087_12505 [Spirochaetes bacterium GWD1_61_31]|nr:MAG: hypothetical protein A2Y37_11505 [Spirochaetes bacterium GWB1_60_80]OHD31645.1 MAG: hypothetical protein A2004_03425 [Spirochaetes bacterium GWC1_61_12]OHD38341.1 MAG: hypothetical protein A2087_12505 [Spirochaetes bacterium GWD1_61_31]OHD43392.1 MAG: hypothetical protein A2Y35_02275 [Spirochaetes bacterium GWE1_60_18]OHD58925.1 MAG: hypothetical protein A2Y32_10720 [Spirochaetes bacterium GWF1_60_12]HAP42979.1 hypothetical protein [Spirochaetaceae bacterium]
MKRLFLALTMLMLVTASLVFAQATPIPGLTRYTLANGLELYVLENHQVPLSRIQITFRCGALTQTPQTAGLFHLYEHMLFKGNARYATERDFSAAMTALGVSEWNGGTSSEYVTYYFTVPSDRTEQGLDFWAQAVRSPLFDEAEFAIEVDVVVNEINGYNNEPDWINSAAVDRALFPNFPWRRDVGGSEEILRAATVQNMRDIQTRYYIPNNGAIFVAGDVDPTEVLAMVERLYGDWQKGNDPWTPRMPAQATPFGPRPVYLVYPDESLPEGIANVDLRMRGPDVMDDPEATYAADVWGSLVASPNGQYRNNLMRNVAGMYHKNYISAYYYTQRDGGLVSFGTYFRTDATNNPLTAFAMQRYVPGVMAEVRRIVNEPNYFSAEESAVVKNIMEDGNILSLEKPEAFIESFSFWWAVATADYYFGYVPNMQQIEHADIAAFLQQYVLDNVAIVSIRANPADVEADLANLQAAGFTVVTTENAFWWRNR